MSQELLPLGSILYLEGATSKLMVVGRGPVFESDNEKAAPRGGFSLRCGERPTARSSP